MRIKDLQKNDTIRCFGATGSYLVTVRKVVTDMTNYRDIAYVIKSDGVQGTLTDNDEWLFYDYDVSNKKHVSNDVQQKKRFEHLKGNLSRLDGLSSKEKLHWNAKGNIETEDGIEISIVETLLKGGDLQTYVTNEISRQRDNKKNNGVITSQSIETIGPNEEVVSHDVSDNQQDIVNKPSHYTYGKIEIIDIVEQVTAAYPTNIAFSIGNALKYICRAPFKNDVEDLKKAVWYLERAIKKWDVNEEDVK